MLTICCECKKILKFESPEPISHGYCELCSAKMLWEGGLDQEEIADFINRHDEVAHAET